MKKTALIAICLVMIAALCACTGGETETTTAAGNKTVTFINGAAEADVWILPETQENLKTTVWGKATLSAVRKGESRTAPLCEPGDDGLYIFRMIDTGSFYYSANGIALNDSMTLKITGEGTSFTLEVTGKDGTVSGEYELFYARL